MQWIEPSCTKPDGFAARPPRRLVEVAKDFGDRAVLGSLCSPAFGPMIGGVLRAAVERIQP